MLSAKRSPTSPAQLRANLEDGLVSDPRILLDPRLLGILHRELEGRLGPDDSAEVLLEAGVFHGLRDALRVAAQEEGGAAMTAHSFPMLALQLTQVDESLYRGRLPEQVEAEARLGGLGPSAAPSCWLSCGYIAGWLSGLLDRDFFAVEHHCVAAGGETCLVEARPAAEFPQAASIPYDLLRERAHEANPPVRDPAREPGPRPPTANSTAPTVETTEDGDAAVHVWGPVMVVPYSGEDTTRAIESVALDGCADAVSVVIVDLGGAVVDDGFAAVALERTVEVIQSWGAEAVIGGASPLSLRLVSGLGQGGLVVREDLQGAIATAFQIADIQRFGN